MKAMTLLRAMSELPPEMLDAAMKAGLDEAADAVQDAVPADEQQRFRKTIKRRKNAALAEEIPDTVGGGKLLRFSGWIAAAACVMLVIGTVLHFRQGDEHGLALMPSVSEVIVEVTGTEPPQTTVSNAAETTASITDVSVNHLPEQAVTTAETARNDISESTDAAHEQTQHEENTTAETEITETTTAATTAVTYAENVPVLVAMGDSLGSLPEATVWEVISDAAQIDAYLNGDSPAVTLGEGQKSADAAAAIKNNCSMLRIRWQKGEPAWTSYGITGAVLGADGVLHLSVAMYSDGSPHYAAEWIYETALLFESGTLPQIKDVALDFEYFEDIDGGIAQWLAYNDKLQDDVYIHIN